MLPEDFYYLGKIVKVVGLKGELLVYLDTDEPEKYYQMGSFFLCRGEEAIPYSVESVKVKNRNQIVVKFEDIDMDKAHSFVGAFLCFPISMLPTLTGNRFYYHEIKGFVVNDLVYGEIGVCVDVLEYPHQALFRIMDGDREVLIPIVDEFIKKVDRKNRVIYVSSPEGLLDIY